MVPLNKNHLFSQNPNGKPINRSSGRIQHKKKNMLQDVFLNVLWNGNQWYSNVFLFYLFFTQFWCQF